MSFATISRNLTSFAMASLAFIVAALCVAVATAGEELNLPKYVGSCPKICNSGKSPYENINVAPLKTYTLYSTLPDIIGLRCVSNIVSKENDLMHTETVMYNATTGEKNESVSDTEKLDDGKVKFTLYYKGVNTTLIMEESYVVKDDIFMSWYCIDFNNGAYTEGATIFSAQTTVPEEIVKDFSKYLKDNGSQLGDFVKIPYDNCPKD